MDDNQFIYSLKESIKESKRRALGGTEMISLRYLKMKPLKDFLDTKEKVGKARRDLEDDTQQDLIKYAQAKRRAYIESQNYVFDKFI